MIRNHASAMSRNVDGCADHWIKLREFYVRMRLNSCRCKSASIEFSLLF